MVDASSVDPNEIANPRPRTCPVVPPAPPERSAPLPRRRSHHAGHGALRLERHGRSLGVHCERGRRRRRLAEGARAGAWWVGREPRQRAQRPRRHRRDGRGRPHHRPPRSDGRRRRRRVQPRGRCPLPRRATDGGRENVQRAQSGGRALRQRGPADGRWWRRRLGGAHARGHAGPDQRGAAWRLVGAARGLRPAGADLPGAPRPRSSRRCSFRRRARARSRWPRKHPRG